MAEAERLYKRSISIVEKSLGPDHPALEVSLNGLIVLYQSQGRKEEAERAIRRVAEVANTRYRGQWTGPMIVHQRTR